MSDEEEGPSGTLVIQPEANPAHRPATSLTAQDDDPATRVADKGPPDQVPSSPPLQPSPTVQFDIPPGEKPTGTLQMATVGADPTVPQYERIDGPGYIPLPSRGSGADRTTAPPVGPSKFVPLVIGAVVALGVGGVGLFLALRGSQSSKLLHEASAPTTPTGDVDVASNETPAPQPSASSAALSLPEADQHARAALERLRTGIKACVENTIHKLPGTSPAVPDGMAWLKHGPYASLKRDWASPFFSCTHFQLEEPMPFAIQWQADPQGTHGTGIVWVDSNSDGVADSAYAFTATVSGGTVTSTDIEAIEPSRPMVHVP